ncbi:DUF397 domain-containing protein [Nocardiopsis lucentensis]|uniref:DUF397 domain-containing protein n=1 Tax=Nocardiopsis lucentensis TaxID=53441 RepID=UPI0012681AE4|nr:DUF397 domain-containing protein [Nocardiopsis lucentensis]
MITDVGTRSSHSPNGGDCVECRYADSPEVRDSKRPDAGTPSFPASERCALLGASRES